MDHAGSLLGSEVNESSSCPHANGNLGLSFGMIDNMSIRQPLVQVAVLNAAFAGAGFSFVLAGLQRVTGHPEWW